METIFLDAKNERHPAHLIHQEDEYFIAYVFSTNDVVVGHPELSIARDPDMQLIHCHDHRQKLNKLFNENGNLDSYLIDYFKNPEPVISYLKTLKLIVPQENA